MNLLDVVTKQDLMKPSDIRDGRNHGGYKLTAYFIKMHGREMGGIGKPMIFDRNRVEAYLDELFGQKEREQAEREEQSGQVKVAVSDAVHRVRSLTTVQPACSGKILGRGGRQKGAMA